MLEHNAPFNYHGKKYDRDSFIKEGGGQCPVYERACALELAEGRDLGSGTHHVETRARIDWKGILDEDGFQRAKEIAEGIRFEPVAFKGLMQSLWPDYLHGTPEYQQAPR